MNTKTLIGALLASVLVLAGCQITVEQPGGIDRDTISVSGNAEMMAAPDQAELFLRVETRGMSAKQAQDDNSRIMTAVQASVKDLGVAKSDIETMNYNLYPRHEWNEDLKKTELVGWQLDHALKVKTKDLEKVGRVVQAAVDAGVNNVERVSFGLSKQRELEIRDSALKNAAQNARQKADSLADSLGVSVRKVVSISESSFVIMPYDRYVGAEVMMAKGAPAPPIQPSEVNVNAQVSVVFEIA